MNDGGVFVSEDGAAISGVESDGNTSTEASIESVDGVEVVVVQNLPNIELVLVPPDEGRVDHSDGPFALTVQVDLDLTQSVWLKLLQKGGCFVGGTCGFFFDFHTDQWFLNTDVGMVQLEEDA